MCLRSAAAGNRFLQPRRRSPHYLVFFNSNAGIWEQWEVVAPAAEEWQRSAWSSRSIVLRSRRLEQVRLRASAPLAELQGSAATRARRSSWLRAQTLSSPGAPRSRPQVQLAVVVTRTGYYAAAPGPTAADGAAAAPAPRVAPTPRSLVLPPIAEDGNVEDTNLRRISSVLVHGAVPGEAQPRLMALCGPAAQPARPV